jgi:hypothetical protein
MQHKILACADDLVPTAEKQDDMQQRLNAVHMLAQKINININPSTSLPAPLWKNTHRHKRQQIPNERPRNQEPKGRRV